MAGETDATDLAERERQAAEDRAFELNPHGTGVDPDIDLNYNYDYEASPELTDADYQPNNSFSDDFTNYAGADPYANQFGQEYEDENNADDTDANGDDYADDYGDEQEDWDGDDEEDEDEANDEDNDADADDDGETVDDNGAAEGEDADPASANRNNAAPAAKTGRDGKLPNGKYAPDNRVKMAYVRVSRNKLKIPWYPGDLIDLALLSSVWKYCRRVKSVRPMVNQANKTLAGALNNLGPNCMIHFNEWMYSVMEQDDDLIGSILKLCSDDSSNKRLALTVGAVAEAIFVDQQWTQPLMLVTLPKAVDGVIKVQPLQGILQKIFAQVVPLVNGMNPKYYK